MEEDNAIVMGEPSSRSNSEKRQPGITIDVENLTNTIKHKLNMARQCIVLERETQVIIPRVPGEHEEFEPRIISIGPYYWGTQRLRSMEEKKRDYAAAFLGRNSVSLKDSIYKLLELEGDVRRCYSEVLIGSEKFVEMMIFDGCFIIEYIQRVDNSTKEEIKGDYMRPIIEHDLLLLQNQLPFFVLRAILDTFMSRRDSYSFLTNLILNFFNRSSFIQKTPSVTDLLGFNFEYIQHLLHSYHWFLACASKLPKSRGRNPFKSYIKVNFQKMSGFCFPLSSNKKFSEDDLPEKDVWSIPSATVLASAGVKFNKKAGSFLLQICFREGTMEIPSFFIDGFTESLIKNLIAFEKFNPAIEPKFTAYVKFLDHLINTSEDVALLHEKRVLDHALGSEKEVARLINSIGGSTFHYQPDYLKRIYKDVDSYCKVKRHKWQESLMRNYFSSPWSFIKLVAGVILLVLAFLQTFFAIEAYFHPRT